MAQDANEGISYLMALKQANSAAPTHPGDPVHASDIPENEYHGINKRRSPRYKCEGSV